MPFTSYTPNIAPWERYYITQADLQLGKHRVDKRKVVYANALVSGGRPVFPTPNTLTKISTVKTAGQRYEDADKVTVNLISPAEATVEQAESELQHVIKESDSAIADISIRTEKRAASTTPGGPKPSKKARKSISKSSTEIFKDIFSKKE